MSTTHAEIVEAVRRGNPTAQQRRTWTADDWLRYERLKAIATLGLPREVPTLETLAARVEVLEAEVRELRLKN